MPTATDVLDAVARKYSRCALIREVCVTDAEAIERLDAWRQDEWLSSPRPATPTMRRIDGLLLDGGGRRTAIEVKISRSDFARESEEKRRPWRKITHRFVYATPAGLLQRYEIPDGCGLWEVGEAGRVHVSVRARINRDPEPIPHQVLVALAYRLKAAS
ncbi:hypothetical protein QNM97_13915 [Gordonia sp. L191]|uniref:hypothetical protein n=1 Tax=Gordonia sp. L191 TaxID=2982699 RepID=UPI0024BFEF6A|nr:hypothetical protein [Gordonia sp. L191]WHU45148.1 hypothetical protein QNM97_13915 [Gordonia sp. L191]